MPSDDLLKDFIKRTDRRLDNIDENVLSLMRFRWIIIGGSMVASFIFTFLFEVAKAMAGSK